jgi:transcriptional regulator with XRE-family HTH domain
MTSSVDDALIPAKAGYSDSRWSYLPTDRQPEPNSQTTDPSGRDPNRGGTPTAICRVDGCDIATSPRRGGAVAPATRGLPVGTGATTPTRNAQPAVVSTQPPRVRLSRREGGPAEEGGRSVSASRRRRAVHVATGEWHPWADPAPVRARVRWLRDHGASYQAIAEAAGLGVMTVHAIANRRGRVTARAAAAILSVSDTDLQVARLDAGGTRLRLRALQTMGHGSARVARAIGVREQAIQKITRGDARTVSPRLRDAVARIYDAWWDKRAPERTRHERSAATAARRGAIRGNWCPGAGLDEDELDIPGYQPACGWRPARGTGVAADITRTPREEKARPRLLEPVMASRRLAHAPGADREA